MIKQHRPSKKTFADTGELRDWVHVCANIHVRQGTVLASFAKRNTVVTVMDSHVIVTPSCSSPTDWYLEVCALVAGLAPGIRLKFGVPE